MIYRRKLFFLLFLCIISGFNSVTVSAELNQNKIHLSGDWKILTGETPASEISSIDDSAWDTAQLPGNLSRYLIRKTGKADGTAWLQKSVFIPESARGSLHGISLGRIANADTTWINGIKVGSTGKFPPEAKSMWNFPRHYSIPESIIRYDDVNVITIKIWYYIYGEIKGDIMITGSDSWNLNRATDFFWRVIVNILIIAMGIPLLVLFSIFYIKRPESSEYLYYSLQLACGFFIVFDLCSFSTLPSDINLRYKLVGASWVALNVVHPMFLHRFYNLKRRNIEITLASYMVLICVPGLFIDSSTILRKHGIILIVLTSAIGFYNLSCHISALYLKRPYAKLFSVFGITVVIGAIHDGINYFSKFTGYDLSVFGYSFDIMIFPVSAAALYIGTAILMVYQYLELQNKNEELKNTLEIKVEERTRSLIQMTEALEQKNIQLTDIAIRDSLTGLYNHAALHERLDDIVVASKHHRFPVCVIMMDVDNFKGFNDTYGHQTGDEVLVSIATQLKLCIREYDFAKKYFGNTVDNNRNFDLAGRYGGDEFVIVLPYCDDTTANSVTLRIASKIAGIRLSSSEDIQIFCSYGIAYLKDGSQCSDSENLIRLADSALYCSKQTGKGKIVSLVYEPE